VDDADNLVSVTSQQGSDPPVLIEAFTHDGDGNMTTRTDVPVSEVITYAWDDFNKLVKVSSADGGGPTTTVGPEHSAPGDLSGPYPDMAKFGGSILSFPQSGSPIINMVRRGVKNNLGCP
jgi:YD repeat-containing protein